MLEPDRDQIEQFVDAVFRHVGTKGFVSLRSFFEGDDTKPARISGTSLAGGLRYLMDAAEDDARRACQHPLPIVFCPPLAVFGNKDRARQQDLTLGPVLSVEIDEHPREALAQLEVVLGPATVVVRSGGLWVNGGGKPEDKIHAHWRLTKPAEGADLANLKQARDLATRLVGGDPSNKPVVHPLRWPGSWHRKAEPRLCEIECLDPDREINLDTALAALRLAAPKAAEVKAGEPRAGSEDKESFATLVNNIITGTNYHHSLVALSARMVGSGMHDGTTVTLLRALMEASIAPHDEVRWRPRVDSIPRIASSAREKFAKPNINNQHQITLRWHGEGTNTHRAWLIDGLLPETGCGLLSGQWSTYKTFVALDLTAAVMAGGRFINHEVIRRGGVLFIAAEGGADIDTRLRAVLETKYPDLGKAPFAWVDQCPRLVDPDAAAELAAIAEQAAARMQADFGVPLVLIIIDTIVASAGYSKSGEENDTSINQMIMNCLATLSRAVNALVLGVDHFGKAVETGTRGSSAKEGAADVVIALLADKTLTGAISNARLALRKSRVAASGQEFQFSVRLVDLGLDERVRSITSLVVDWGAKSKEPEKSERWSKSLRLLRQTLMNVLVDHGREQRPFPDGPMVRAVDIEIVRQEFHRSYPAEGDAATRHAARRKAFHRAIVAAQEQGLVGVREVNDVTIVWLINPQDEAR